MAHFKIAGACVVVVLAGLIVIAQTSVGKSLSRGVGLASSSEPFSELYFADQGAVAAATQGEDAHARTQRVAFVIANRESRQMTYHWEITAAGRVRATGTTELASGASRTVTPAEAITTGCEFTRSGKRVGPQRTKITVSLPGQADAVSYWVACRA